jgi:cysteinyl-tRNA synthetase
MTLKLFNTLTKSKEDFIPINEKTIKMYACGPTLYNNPHIGNFRPIIVFDILFRILQLKFGKENVTYVRNITDIDDKIINKANELKISTNQLVEETQKVYHEDLNRLSILKPTHEPKATEFISKMIDMIKILIEKEYAYVSSHHVLFESRKFNEYGTLSKLSFKDIINGARVEVAEYKKNPEDFVLWKPSKDNEPYWESPWGKGRPGWHIECSAMIAELLGPTIDIHAGGLDLIFPHHENEIAQSSCCHDQKMANYWLHNGFINFQGEKMSKSLGNITIMNELLVHHNPTSIKYAILTTHYRQPIDFSDDLLKYSSNIVLKWRGFIKESSNNDLDQDFLKALEDDLNTPQALMRLQQIFNELKKSPKDEELSNYFNNGLSILGLIPDFQELEINLDNDLIENMIARRADAKLNKNFELADQIREELINEGIILEDTKSGTKWKKI